MSTKLKNDPRNYLSRAKLGGGAVASSNHVPAKKEIAEAKRRIEKGSLDNRWYIQLEPRKKS